MAASGHAGIIVDTAAVASDDKTDTSASASDELAGDSAAVTAVHREPKVVGIGSPPGIESGIAESGSPVRVELVEGWELRRCRCPELGPLRRRPMDRIIPGESQLRCFECFCPYYRAAERDIGDADAGIAETKLCSGKASTS